MTDADRVALVRRPGGAIPLRRREEPDEAPTAPDGPDTPAANEPPVVERVRPFAGLAEQVRAAGSGQVPAARTPLEPPAVPATPATPPAETA
jgi:hypothetical protein